MVYNKEKYQQYREAVRAAQRRYYQKNKERLLAVQKKYDDEHRDQIRQRHMKYSKSKLETRIEVQGDDE
ncbi:TPA: hypothetical protein N0F65_003604 [Lagenidium giganteum]|uniref:Berberine/berberine-like domain-containing protein n=1 Tax=Lagenidium giganteum TaxID=4803 RepID=A0AAV2Z4F2_9STRA|nr:TPA: hypothetical protein N0F65_003603 [Lagenidium giganteum]DBA00675.1 TPA: hypothetical protein N0F65_003604 [Lagenidium giganteum]